MKKILPAMLLSMFLLSAITVSAMAQLTPGVEVGDWFKYEAHVTEWTSADPFLPEGYQGPLTLADNETNYILYTVADITSGDGGDNVTFDITYDWINGTTTYGTLVENVSTSNTGIFVIGANMTAGDMVSDEWNLLGFFDYPARYINETFALNANGTDRDTNSLEYAVDIFGSVYNYTYWWDKTTGIRVYYAQQGDLAEFGGNPAYTYAAYWSLIDSSVDGLIVPDLTGPILFLAIMSISTPIALLCRRKKLFN